MFGQDSKNKPGEVTLGHVRPCYLIYVNLCLARIDRFMFV
jgi:hypothetical protein